MNYDREDKKNNNKNIRDHMERRKRNNENAYKTAALNGY